MILDSGMIDTIIVGAGPSGLCAAKTILQCDPSADVKIYDAHKTVGGVWSKEKITPLLKTNHHFGGLDFSDFPMQEGNGAQRGKHIPGSAVHEFFCQYARRWNLEERIEFDTRVLEVARPESGEGWELKIQHNGTQQTRQCRKLIIAIGINNAPNIPDLKGASDFQAPILHSSQMGTSADELFGDDATRTVAVLGGGKSAYDAVYYAATSGRQVEWIIRKSGKGPVWVFPLLTKIGPFVANREQLPGRRIVSFFSPCIWNDGFAWIRKWIHNTVIGKFVAQLFWAQIHADTIKDCGYRTDERLKILEPETSPFWYGTVAGAYSYEPGLFEYVKNGRVRVWREDVSSLSQKEIHLATGEKLQVDALICGTGFSAKPTIQFNPPSLHSDIGIPTTHLSAEQTKFWSELDTKSDRAVLQQFPRLLGGPFQTPRSESVLPYNAGAQLNYSPFRLFRSIAPPGLTANGDRSLAFIGVFSNFANHARLEVQCLWAYAYMNNKLAIDEKGAFAEASLMNRYSRHRSPFGHGSHFPDHVFDQLPYFDVLMRDLSLNPRRKNGFLQEIFGQYGVEDYRGIVGEWLRKNTKV